MPQKNKVNLERDWSNSPKDYEDVYTYTQSVARRFRVPVILPIADYEDIHIPLEAILHYDFTEQDQFIKIFERRIRYLNELIGTESTKREEKWRKTWKKVTEVTKEEEKFIKAMDGPYKGNMTDREKTLRKKKTRCEVRLELCKSLFAQGMAFPFEKLPTEIRCNILSYLVVKPDPIPASSTLEIDRQTVFRVSKQFRAQAAYAFFTGNSFYFKSLAEINYIIPRLEPDFLKLVRNVHFAMPKSTWPPVYSPLAGQLLQSCPSLMHLTIRANSVFHSTTGGHFYVMDKPLFTNLLACHPLKSVDVVTLRGWVDDKEDHEFCRSHLEACLRERLVPDSKEALMREQRKEEVKQKLRIGEVAGTRSEKMRLEWELRGLGFKERDVVKALSNTDYNSKLALEELEGGSF